MGEARRETVSVKVLALCKAAATVRGGAWIQGAPTHILAEMLSALERDGWMLVRMGLDHPSHRSKQKARGPVQ